MQANKNNSPILNNPYEEKGREIAVWVNSQFGEESSKVLTIE